MDLENLKNKFFDMEISFDLFEKQTSDGLLWWDIVRYKVFELLMFDFNVREYNEPNRSSKITKNFNLIIKLLLNEFLFRLNIKNRDYIVYMVSRNINRKGYSYDLILEEIYELLYKDSLILESNIKAKRKRFVYYNFKLLFNRKINKLKNSYREYKLGVNIEEIFYKTFGKRINVNYLIHKVLTNYEIEYTYYYKLFKKINPKIVLSVEGTSRKAWIKAANDLNIITIEFQHGAIHDFHLLYSYPKEIKKGSLKTFPTYFFTLGEFWNKINYPVKEKIAIGNNFYAKKIKEKDNSENNVLIIFANIYTNELLNLTKNMVESDKKRKYIIKLHPDQIKEIKKIKIFFEKYKNVEVIGIEKSITEILGEVKNVLAIQSTVLYEALQRKKKIIIYKKYDYIVHKNLFNLKNVYLVKDHLEALGAIEKDFVEDIEPPIFFEEFNKERFLKILKKIENFNEQNIGGLN